MKQTQKLNFKGYDLDLKIAETGHNGTTQYSTAEKVLNWFIDVPQILTKRFNMELKS